MMDTFFGRTGSGAAARLLINIAVFLYTAQDEPRNTYE
jgi:hypothetical protein